MNETNRKPWSESFGSYGSTIRIAERQPGGTLYVFYTDGSGTQRKRSLGHRNKGRARADARDLAATIAQQHAAGRSAKLFGRQSTQAEMTLEEGILAAYHPSSGMFPVESRHKRETRALLRRFVARIGGETLWSDLTPSRVRTIFREMASESADGGGFRTAILTCDMVYRVATWLREEDMIPQGAAVSSSTWKVRFQRDWEAITGSVKTVHQPRHTEDEIQRLFAVLPEFEPRFELLVECGAWLRAGQVLRSRRSDLELGAVGSRGLGRLTVRGAGAKSGEKLELDEHLRGLFDRALSSGYLRLAERAYRRGEIDDYYLFPGYRLIDGVASVKNATRQPLGEKTIRTMFHALEERAGVEPQRGRAFYGLRRTGTDLAADLETDDRVLDRVSGHRDSETRKKIYQNRESERVLARATDVRTKLRKKLGGKAPE